MLQSEFSSNKKHTACEQQRKNPPTSEAMILSLPTKRRVAWPRSPWSRRLGFEGIFPRNISCSLFCLGLAFDKKDPCVLFGEKWRLKLIIWSFLVWEMCSSNTNHPSKFLYTKLVGWLALMFVSLDPFLYELVGWLVDWLNKKPTSILLENHQNQITSPNKNHGISFLDRFFQMGLKQTTNY